MSRQGNGATVVSNHARRLAVGFASVAMFTTMQASRARADVYTTIDFPGATDTYVKGIQGNVVVGYYDIGSGSSATQHGFIYDGSAYHTFDFPGGSNTQVRGVNGTTHVGVYDDAGGVFHGFEATPSGTTTLDYPGADESAINAIAGGLIVGGYYDASNVHHGWSYDGSTFKSLDVPGTSDSTYSGTDGTRIAGGYAGADGFDHGFVYDGTSYTSLDVPLASSDDTDAVDVDGANVIGEYFNETDFIGHGFLYDGSSFTYFDEPLAGTGFLQGTTPTSIDGNKIGGFYTAADGQDHGFVLTLTPEPASTALAVIPLMGVLTGRRRRRGD